MGFPSRKKEGILVVGDVNLDLCTQNFLPFSFNELTKNGRIVNEPMMDYPGGTGLLFAREAKRRGLEPFLIGKTGRDFAGNYIKAFLEKEKIEYGISESDSMPTGRAFIVRDKKDIRLLIDSTLNANHELNEQDISRYTERIHHCRALYISGYVLNNQSAPRFKAMAKLFEMSSEKCRHRILDVVPHQIYKTYTFEEFRTITKPINFIISEVPTMRRFFNLGNREEEINDSIAEETADKVKHYYDSFILRWGPSGTDYELFYSKVRNLQIIQPTNHSKLTPLEKRGYGDKLTVEALYNIFQIFQNE